ncbi:MAG TPA: LLM class flavin-dependent oxidoreductase, partial [Promineifilum sp.]|nr:LLM class flavin-dependent oxidoreductase [Promineifilum sp.]
MSSENETLTYERLIPARPADLYRAFTSSTALREWLCDTATTSARPNGHVFVGWNDGYYATGHFVELLENRVVCFTWQGRGEPRPTQVHVAIQPATEGTALTLTHSAIGQGPEWGDKTEEFDRAWRRALENLESVVTTGEDLRVTRRPMLGILPATLTAAEASRLGLPDAEGVRLSGTVPELGAAAAGLRADDVITAIDGLPTPDINSLRAALRGRNAGDTVVVDFIREGQRHSTGMNLSGRKIPAIPATAEELVDRVAARRAVVRERILAMQELWGEEAAAFHGEHVQMAESWAWPKPTQQVQGRTGVPVLVGGAPGPILFEHIAEFADGWIPIGGAGVA